MKVTAIAARLIGRRSHDCEIFAEPEVGRSDVAIKFGPEMRPVTILVAGAEKLLLTASWAEQNGRVIACLWPISTAQFENFHNLTSDARWGIMGASIADSSLLRGTVADWRERMSEFIRRICSEEEGQDIAEYAVMLAVILVLVVGTIRLIGSNANNAFSNVASSIQ
jgi:Flp pilus assembly pilin Flp